MILLKENNTLKNLQKIYSEGFKFHTENSSMHHKLTN